MSSFKVLLCAVALALTEIPVDSFFGGGTSDHNAELSKAELTALYNSPVFKAEKMKRPLLGVPFMLGPFSHSGVRVTLANGDQWLIHKGDNYGQSSQTVVVNAEHMSSKWKVVESKKFDGRKRVADFVEAGGSEFTWWDDNCHKASDNMMNQVTLADGAQWLVHKGDDYGKSSQTVVTRASDMSSGWEVIGERDFEGTKTVGDFVKVGGTDYSVLFDNCHHASGRMMEQ
ncbi:uncharacterized protein LOC141801253 [Halichoeres trimaculatus]|uniref:uncharacterized protein LOC141801253 n=1 Tax=Halichoeres trimaculatus TaxID=147232 RepID=UPI003D9F4E6B